MVAKGDGSGEGWIGIHPNLGLAEGNYIENV